MAKVKKDKFLFNVHLFLQKQTGRWYEERARENHQTYQKAVR